MKTLDELEYSLGQHLRTLRIRENLTQRELADRSGVALNAVKNLEAGKGATTRSLISILRTLGKEGWLSTLAPVVTVSPMQLLKTRNQRLRVRKPRVKEDV